jgi:hypothetical protein
MQCKCGAESLDGAKFCSECGKRLPKPKPIEAEIAACPIIREVDPILKPAEAARMLKISRWKLDELRIQDKLPLNCYFIVPSRGEGVIKTVRYRAQELLKWAGMHEEPFTTTG